MNKLFIAFAAFIATFFVHGFQFFKKQTPLVNALVVGLVVYFVAGFLGFREGVGHNNTTCYCWLTDGSGGVLSQTLPVTKYPKKGGCPVNATCNTFCKSQKADLKAQQKAAIANLYPTQGADLVQEARWLKALGGAGTCSTP